MESIESIFNPIPLNKKVYLLTILCIIFRFIVAMEEFPVEQLDSNHGKNKKEEYVNNEDIEDILEWYHNAVEHSF